MKVIDGDVPAECLIVPDGFSGDCFIHSCAQVDDNVTIGRRTRVWQFASVIRKAKIGDDCSVASCSIVDGSCLGNRVIVSHGAFIDPGIRIGDDVFIGPGVKVCNDYWPRVSKRGWHDMADLISGKIIVTVVGNGASIGAGAIILPGVLIGIGAMIAAGAVVTKTVGKNMLWRHDGMQVEFDEEQRIAMRKRHVFVH